MRGATPDANVERGLEEACLLTLGFVIGGMMEGEMVGEPIRRPT